MNQGNTPYVCHILVCINDRHGERPSCSDGMSLEIRDRLKEEVEKRGWKPRVRVSQSGCLGLCERGSNVMIYPQGIWFSAVTPADADAILAEVEKLIQG